MLIMVHLSEEHCVLLLLLRGALPNPAEETLACVDDEAVVRVQHLLLERIPTLPKTIYI